MMVTAALCAAAVVGIGLFVLDGGMATRTAAKMPRLRPAGLAPAGDYLIQEES
jgi:hypothetical protein